MQINFTGPDFSDHRRRGEIDDVLQRICVGEQQGMWREKPDEIRILRGLKGGRGASEVLEVVLRRGGHEARKVVKLGPIYELENEFHSFNKHLRNAGASFVPIEAVTPGVLDSGRARKGDREAVVYDHADRFQGGKGAATRTFEELAREAVDQGGAALDAAVEILETLFQGIRNDLYEKREIDPQETTQRKPWNRRLGIDAVVAVDRIDSPLRMLETTAPWEGDALRPLHVAIASSRVDSNIARDDPVKLYNARMTWWGRRLMAEFDPHFLRVEVVADGGGDIRALAGEVEEGSEWSIQGRLKSSRLAAHRDRLLNSLGAGFGLENNTLHGQGARTPDPFSALGGVLDGPRAHRVTSLIHGDLNPRNILVINKTPCLIDYAYTNMGEPL
ncbi:MAG: hypothetical protein GY859_18805, partial [Desulfobacterales bacterium]|nr:hypothetical protein [Desulfobacterales bacterium]